MSVNPLVSISCVTFNHAPYLRECLEGFLMQQCNFKFEILIHDDASTDGTRAIIEEYTQKYPDIFFPMYQTENQYSQGVRGMMAKFNFPRCRGKYIALCEGDDYWTDSLKLQKQVDFLETNPEYSLVCGGFKSINTITLKEQDIIKVAENTVDNTQYGFDITLERFFKQWLTKTLTLVFRKEFYNPSDFINYKYGRDVHLNYHLLRKGKGYYMKEVFGVYHVHLGGVFSLTTNENKFKMTYLIAKDLYKNNKTESTTQIVYFDALRNIIKNKLYRRDKSLNKNKLIVELLILARTKNQMKKTIKTIFNWE